VSVPRSNASRVAGSARGFVAVYSTLGLLKLRRVTQLAAIPEHRERLRERQRARMQPPYPDQHTRRCLRNAEPGSTL
jgi:hypothetical protein